MSATADVGGQPGIEHLLLHYAVERFLVHEAELLDSRQFEAWLDLLTDDIRYWMPISRNTPFGHWDEEHTHEGRDLNWFDEGKFELEQRVKQILTGKHWAEEPISRTTHMVSNLDVAEEADGHVRARCRFLVYRNRTETETDFFIGKREDRLRRSGDSFKIASRKIFLDQNVLTAKNLTLFF
ncbi:MAG: 3-phenylpropionate/cinnamic acid dioxygenase subunit beta [Alphaproteobacteria bacterium]|nr:3-phenylpropionate/cinnamic acid dioxygenase subunit beta [Alphaproteobacteria bacterium]